MNSETSDNEWIERFYVFSQGEGIRRYQEHFKTDEYPESRPTFTIETKWFTEEGKEN